MKNALAIIGSLIVVVSFLPYLKLTIKRKIKPRIASWATWSLVTGIAAVASFADHAYASGFLTSASTFICLYILFFALRNGDTAYNWLDVACQITSLIGVIAWLLSKDPLWAIVFSIIADFFGGVPTFYHAYIAPHEEAWQSFIIYGAGSFIVLLGVTKFDFANAAFPAYLALMGTLQGFNIIYWQSKLKTRSK